MGGHMLCASCVCRGACSKGSQAWPAARADGLLHCCCCCALQTVAGHLASLQKELDSGRTTIAQVLVKVSRQRKAGHWVPGWVVVGDDGII